MANVNGLIDDRNVERPQSIPIDRFHIHGHVLLAKDNQFISIGVELEPKPNVRIKLLLP
jgi:hypothetical protein